MPWAAIIPAVIGAASSYLSARQAAKAGRPTATDREIQGQLLQNLRGASPYGLDFLRTASQDIGGASDFANSMLRGGYQNALGLLGPELSANARGNESAYSSLLRNSPRTGGTGGQRLGLMDSLSTARNNALVGLRPTAASMLASIGGQAGSLGSGLLSGQSASGLGMLGYGLQQRQGVFDMSRSAMQGLASTLGGLDWGSIIKAFSGSGSGGYSGPGFTGASSPYGGAFSGFGSGVSGSINLKPGTGG